MQTVHFDLSKKSDTPVLNGKQGDVGRKFKAVLTDNGVAYNIPAGSRFSVWFSGPGGEGNYSSIDNRSAVTLEGNTVTVELIAQMLRNPGIGTMCLILNDADGHQLGLWNAVYAVEPVPGMDSEAAEDYYTALSELARQAINAAATFETDAGLSVSGKAADAAATGTALAGKAPAGYGLGTAVKTLNSFNDAYGFTGFYRAASDGPDSQAWSGLSWYDNGTDETTQLVARPGNRMYLATRKYFNSAWTQWEWMNAPMGLGVEYRTTERWNGKAVYTKLIDLGTLPTAGTQKTVSANIAATEIADYRITLTKTSSGSASVFPANDFYTGNAKLSAYFDRVYGIFYLYGVDDMSGYTGKAIIKYTKD